MVYLDYVSRDSLYVMLSVFTMKLDQKLVDSAIAQALSRFPSGYAGAAAVYRECGQILTCFCFDTHNEIANLCHETGAYCEANRQNLKVTASVCDTYSLPHMPRTLSVVG